MLLFLSTYLRSWQMKNNVFVILTSNYCREKNQFYWFFFFFLVLQSKSVLNFILCMLLVLLSHSCGQKNLLTIYPLWSSPFPQWYKYIRIHMLFLVHLLFFPFKYLFLILLGLEFNEVHESVAVVFNWFFFYYFPKRIFWYQNIIYFIYIWQW